MSVTPKKQIDFRPRIWLAMALLLVLLSQIWGNWGNLGADWFKQSPVPVTTSGMLSPEEKVAFWQARIDANPQDYLSLTYLGQAYLEGAREWGDAGIYAHAEAALRQALELNPHHEKAQTFLVSALFSQHKFSEALTMAQTSYEEYPQSNALLGLIGDANLELGHYSEAEQLYQQLAQVGFPNAGIQARLARMAWLKGQPETAIATMEKATELAEVSGLGGESTAWYLFQLGELYFQTGDVSQAKKQYTRALAYLPNYALATAGMGKVAAADGDYAAAISWYEQAVTRVPRLEFLAALGDVYLLAGEPKKAEEQFATVEAIATLDAANQVLYNRQLTLFYANHGRKIEDAVTLAQQELLARQDIYGYDTLAWALYQRGDFAAAADAMAQAMQLGTQDALVFYHAGMIEAALGNHATARDWLTRALAMNPAFDPWQVPIAQAKLTEIGD